MPENFTELSIWVSEVRDGIVAENDTVMERRGTYMSRERMETIITSLGTHRFKCFHFGSQSDETTTPDLQSYIDFSSQ
ncbi:hypothetical protein DPMN_171664 [Dreissena polymorpha]|uniref:Uncharacterized protein n=1 Tax=Dreissena polymorpha TaxID=45954 RepID=A0A9D4DYE7_DREPO|nr:hypothetical protein DPMN_171664 [Dreissena polymorpha]